MTVRDNQHKGMALLVVVVLVMLISLGAYRFSFYMESQYRVTRTAEEQVHARLAAISGLELAMAIVELPLSQRVSVGGLANNASAFCDIIVSDAPLSLSGDRDPNAWRFSLVSPLANESTTGNLPTAASSISGSTLAIRFGLENESAKLHIPTLLAWDRMKPGHARLTLLGLPGTNEAIVDVWLRELGVSNPINKQDAASRQSILRDDIKQAWFGGDLNQNYRLDPMERRLMSQNMGTRSAQSPVDSSPNPATAVSPLSPLQHYLTWVSGHRNRTRNGTPRVNLNDPDLAKLHRELLTIWPLERVNFVIAMRQYGPGGVAPQMASAPQIEWVQNWSPDLSKSAIYSFRSALELVGEVVDLPPGIGSNESSGKTGTTTSVKRIVRSPFSSDLSDARNYLGSLLDTVTVDSSPASIGRVDASEAPFEVLAGVPGMDLTLAQRIVQLRSEASNTRRTEDGTDTIAWLVDAMDLTKLKELEPYLSSRSDVYSVQSIGYRDNRSAVYRMTATIDACEIPAQLRNSKVWHAWDRGFSVEQLTDSKP